jgi:hypothetical protein
MADAFSATGLRPVANGNSSVRPGGASSAARVNSVRPVNPLYSTGQGFSNVLENATRDGDPEHETAVKLDAGSGMLSKDIQFLLAETRMQEDNAPSPAPSNVGIALGSYAKSEAHVRETIGAVRLKQNAANTPTRPQETVSISS